MSLDALRVRARKGGQYLSHMKGRGMEFDEARLYQAGDDPRSIDWRVTARTGRVYTKLFREERERPVFCWVDQRRSMQFATRGVFKSVQAARLAALLAWAAVHRGDRLGGFVFSDHQRVELRPLLGRRAALRLIHQIVALQNSVDTDAAPADLVRTLAALRRVARPGSLVALVSDFAGFDDAAAAHLTALAQHNDVIVCLVSDPLERELPPAGVYPFQIGTRRFRVRTGGQRTAAWRDRFSARASELEAICRATGSSFCAVSTDDSALRALQSLTGSVR